MGCAAEVPKRLWRTALTVKSMARIWARGTAPVSELSLYILLGRDHAVRGRGCTNSG